MLLSEIKKIVRSLSYVLFVEVMLGTYLVQMLPCLDEPIDKPLPGAEKYGEIVAEEPSVLIPAATASLIEEYLKGYYVAYPIMFYKEVHLKAADREKIANIIETVTNLTKEDLDSFEGYEAGGYTAYLDENGKQITGYKDAVMPEYQLSDEITYEEFKELMYEADKIIGGGSKYSEKNIVNNFSELPMSYEDALEEYEQIVTNENVGKSYTRVFCDYMGIFLAVITIFTAASFWDTDKRAKTTDLIYSRKAASSGIVTVRIAALFISMLPAIILPYIHMVIKVSTLYSGINICWWKAFSEMLLWLLPEMLFVIVLSALITEAVSPFLAIFAQGAWWYMALEMNNLVGDINKWTLILRHNSLGELSVWESEVSDFIWNRSYYLCLSFVLLICLIAVFDLKRKGKMRFGYKIIKRNNYKKSFAVL